MKNTKIKTRISIISVILLLAISTTLTTIPFTLAQEPATVYPYPYINAMPNPVQVNQPVLFHVGSQYPTSRPQLGWYNLEVELTDPDGTIIILTATMTDTTGGTGVQYTPTKVGTYTVRTHFPEQVKEFSDSYTGSAGTIMEDAYSEPLELVVQTEATGYWPGFSLPTQYWTRPVNGQIREWSVITGPWLETVEPTSTGAEPSMTDPLRELNAYAPESSHILFRTQLQMAGLAGGNGEHQFESGDAYEGFWNGDVIIGGILFNNQFKSGGGSNVEQIVNAIDLHTGEKLWSRPLTTNEGQVVRLSFGMMYYFENFNYHGVFSYLIGTSGRTWHFFDPFSGRYVFSIEDVPSGTRFRTSDGDIFVYNTNTRSDPPTISLWSVKETVMYGRSGVFEGSWLWGREGSTFNGTNGIVWTIDFPELDELPGSIYKIRDGIILGADFARGRAAPDPAHMWVIAVDNVNPENTEVLWSITWPAPSERIQLSVEDVSTVEDLIICSTKQTRQTYGFRLSTGEMLWGPTPSRFYTDTWGHSSGNSWDIIANGYNKVIAGNYGGTVWCYNAETGAVEWTYDINDPYAELLHNNKWRFRPAFIAAGKLYLENTEHNPEDPQHRGAPLLCLDIETGEKLWQLPYRNSEWSSTVIIGDSIVVTQNTYDQHLYAIGKGPSKTTVEAPLTGITQGSSVVIRGTVMDISPGTTDPEIALRFPNGVPAMSDASMDDWMCYVWNQFNWAIDPQGVDVFVVVQDPNGDYYSETVTTDANGVFSMSWAPSLVGDYQVTVMFQGSASYYQSWATTSFVVDPAPATPAYNGPSADDIAANTAQRTIAMLPPYPNVPTQEQVAADAASRTIAMLPAYPQPYPPAEIPAYQTVDIVIIILVVVAIIIGIYLIIKKK